MRGPYYKCECLEVFYEIRNIEFSDFQKQKIEMKMRCDNEI